MRNAILSLSFLLTMCSFALADSGTIQPCSLDVFSLSYSPLTQKIYMGCCGDEYTREFQVIDPVSLNIDKSFSMDFIILWIESFMMYMRYLFCAKYPNKATINATSKCHSFISVTISLLSQS